MAAAGASTYASWHGEELSVEQQIKNHVARESFGLGEGRSAGREAGDGGGAEDGSRSWSSSRSRLRSLLMGKTRVWQPVAVAPRVA